MGIRLSSRKYIAYREGSHSGRVHRLGKAAYLKEYREFESPPLRMSEYAVCKGGFIYGLEKCLTWAENCVRLMAPAQKVGIVQAVKKIFTKQNV
jgi:hypothetical protein